MVVGSPLASMATGLGSSSEARTTRHRPGARVDSPSTSGDFGDDDLRGGGCRRWL